VYLGCIRGVLVRVFQGCSSGRRRIRGALCVYLRVLSFELRSGLRPLADGVRAGVAQRVAAQFKIEAKLESGQSYCSFKREPERGSSGVNMGLTLG
jgi:hypothetical protein